MLFHKADWAEEDSQFWAPCTLRSLIISLYGVLCVAFHRSASMAEVVGLVASSIELGRTVAGLVKFCGLVKSAPQQLIAIKEDALLLEIVLKSLMKLSEDGVDLTATEEWDICHRHCMVLTSDLQQLLSDLERKVVDRRVFGSIESVLKRHRVQELQERLRDAKANLGLIMSSRNLT